MKPTLEDILAFVAEHANAEGLNATSDIERDLSVYADDWHDMIDDFAEKYEVDMSGYLWYFHSGEEGSNIGGVFFKPPYERVERIPISPNDLLRIATKQRWDLDYPEHTLPKRRYDLIIGTILLLALLALFWYL